ncbi:unnamed protein product [Cylindrotheca closterium]|uniref:L domain-like protein n=1 Tax=Cylindrotheca closterium TaxID=2856 RepID=A0AAD2CC52_9STRA|nr:unnamed protein product [Cylindrotheca closterium]
MSSFYVSEYDEWRQRQNAMMNHEEETESSNHQEPKIDPPRHNHNTHNRNQRNQQLATSQISHYNSTGANSSLYVKSDDAPPQQQEEEEDEDLGYFDIHLGPSARVSALHLDVRDSATLIPTRESDYGTDPKPVSWNVRKSNSRANNKKTTPARSRQSNLYSMDEVSEEDDEAIIEHIERSFRTAPLHTSSDTKSTAPLASSPSSDSKNSRDFTRPIVAKRKGSPKPTYPEPNRRFGLKAAIFCLGMVGLIIWLLNSQGQIRFWEQTESPKGMTTGTSPAAIPLARPAKSTFVQEFGTGIEEYLDDPDSPQFKAAKWMDEVDTRFQLPLVSGDSAAFRQRFVLATFYFATGGGDGFWYDDYSFLSASHECNWNSGSSGIQCNSSRVVIGIKMLLNGLRGSLPPEIGALENLQSITLDGNRITGSIPEEIYRLTNLRSLSMPFNQFSGSISPSIGNLQELTTLCLEQGSLGGTFPAEMNFLTNLETVELSKNFFVGRIPYEMANFPRLQKLDVSNNNLRGRIPQGSYRGMEEFIVDTNQLTGEFPRSVLRRKLTKLSLHNNRLSGKLPLNEWTTATSLESIDISYNEFQGRIPPTIGSIRDLNTLVARDAGLSGPLPPDLDNTSLEVLNVEGNSLSGSIPLSYANLPLVQFAIGRNLLAGDISFLCALSTIQELSADCARQSGIFCSCCTTCFSKQQRDSKNNIFDRSTG